MSRTVVLATGNRGKVAELAQMLAGADIDLRAQSAYGVPEAAETGLTFVENALIKARNAARHTGLAAIADDSGLEVDALDGHPGIYSSRFAGANASDADNNRKLVELLRKTPETTRSARFQCVLVYLRHAEDPVPLICQGTWEGRIILEPHGDNGFGYDPHFYVPELAATAASLPPEHKNRVSHRARALAALVSQLQD